MLASAGWDGATLWDVTIGERLRSLTEDMDVVKNVSFSPDGKTLASVGLDNVISLWDVITSEQKRMLTENGNNEKIFSISFSADGQTIVSASEKQIHLWDVDTGNLYHSLIGHRKVVYDVEYSPDGQTIASGSWGVIRLWDANTHELIRTLTGHTENIRSLSFSPDGQTIAGSSWSKIGLWDVKTGKLNHTLREQPISIESVSFGPEGRTIASSNRNTIRLWDVNTGKVYHTLSGHAHYVNSLAFSQDGSTLASGSIDGTVLVWDYTLISPKAIYPPEDVNTDGVINIQDLVLVAQQFGETSESVADINGDGIVNILDLILVAGALGNTASAPDILSLKLDTMPTRAEVEAWLHEARQINFTDPAFQRGILVLEQLLGALTPKETVLLPNYPNPFNPETWIPYQLAKPSNVSISIYAVDGKLVRMLNLGHQPVGVYESRSRAAYWDGKNAQAESVASGIYFYTLTAGDVGRSSQAHTQKTATRKMLIKK